MIVKFAPLVTQLAQVVEIHIATWQDGEEWAIRSKKLAIKVMKKRNK